jgi:hypothetical protein
MVRFRLLLHLGFDLREVFGRDAMREFDIVVEAVLDRRTGGELRLGPDLENGGSEHVRGGMAEALDVRHRGTLLGCFAVVAHRERIRDVSAFVDRTSEAVARRWAADWRGRSVAVICARCAAVLRSLDIGVGIMPH